MRIAIPVCDDWIAPVFDSATRLMVVDIGPDRRSEQSELPSFVRPPKQRADELASLGIDLLLCDGISDTLARFVKERGIEIKACISWAVDEVLLSLSRTSRAVTFPLARAT